MIFIFVHQYLNILHVISLILQTTYSPSKVPMNLNRSSPSRSRSPIKTVTKIETSIIKNDDAERKEKSEETYKKEVTEKKTTILDEPKISGNKETYKKTTITEKEETIQKTEVLKFTQTVGASKTACDVDPLQLFEDRRNQRRNEREVSEIFKNQTSSNTPTKLKSNSTSVTKSVKFGDGQKQKLSEFNSTDDKIGNDIQEIESNEKRKLGSPSKFASCRDRSTSPAKRTMSEVSSTKSSLSSPTRLNSFGSTSDYTSSPSRWSPIKDEMNYVFNTTINESNKTDVVNSEVNPRKLDYNEDDWNEASAGNRKRRLKNLASKFHEYDEDENERINARLLANAAVSPSPDVLGRRNTSKVVDIDQELSESTSRRSRSPTKKPNRNEASFIQSLKAQGFEESESKSKLVYDFKNSPNYRSSSPTKLETSGRPASPYKHNPHQFICPQKGSPACMTPSTGSGEKSWKNSAYRSQSPQKTPAYRSVSPTRMLDPKPNSPFKPHPLQFISPKKFGSPANQKTTSASEASCNDGPPKPQRIFANSGTSHESSSDRNQTDDVPISKNEELVNSQNAEQDEPPLYAPPSPPKREYFDDLTDSKTQTDTASRRSILEKKSMFENVSSALSPSKDSPDPAMLPLSQRKALFEKNRSIPKPIARFGESVTPAMLSKAHEGATPAVSYNRPIPASEPAWKRKRDISPQKFINTPTIGNHSPISSSTESKDGSQTAGIHQRFEKSRRLFENVTNDWRESDIAKTSNEAKKNDMEVLMNRFKMQREKETITNTEKDNSKFDLEKEGNKTPEYPGVNSLKKIKVSPPKPGQIYPDLNDIYTSDSASDMDRPGTAMSDDSCAPSEAPSLGCTIKHFASSHKLSHMPSISENKTTEVTEREATSSADDSMTEDDQINDMLDEALDVSPQSSPRRTSMSKRHSRSRVVYEGLDDGATPPKSSRLDNSNGSPISSASTKSWEYQTANTSNEFDFKTPRIEPMKNSPMKDNLPYVETEDGIATPASDLMHTVSFYRKQRGPIVNVTPHAKIIRKVIPSINEEEEDNDSGSEKDDLEDRIKKLQTEVEEQMQRRMQASKALQICASKNEFEGSYERVEFERLLLEAHHKYAASTTEMNRLKTEGARRMSASSRNEAMKKSSTKGAISISGISIPLKADFIRLMSNVPDQDTVHYFLCLVKYRSQVIATQMLSTLDGISARKNKLVFTNLINVNELDFDFQIYLEVYGLQTPRERLSHEAKYHIRKEKSLFNLTPLKKLKKQELRYPGSGRENPVNSLSIGKSKFGLVGYTTITIDTLKTRNYRLQKVPPRSPLDDGLEMKLNVYSESRVS